MVRLSVIVLGLLAAAWCFTGAAEGWRVNLMKASTVQLSCGAKEVIKLKWNLSKKKPCGGMSVSSDSVKCISIKSRVILYLTCKGKTSCNVASSSLTKGRHTATYKCVRA